MPLSASESTDPIALATDIISAFVANNSLPLAELPSLIQSVHAALVEILRGTVEPTMPEVEMPRAMVTVKKSITRDYLICLDDGLKFKSLRRHLTALGMTPDQYRAKWGLPKDYPMVAVGYAASRSAIALKFGFGQSRKKSVAPVGNSAS